jgi:hypothetical protein
MSLLVAALAIVLVCVCVTGQLNFAQHTALMRVYDELGEFHDYERFFSSVKLMFNTRLSRQHRVPSIRHLLCVYRKGCGVQSTNRCLGTVCPFFFPRFFLSDFFSDACRWALPTCHDFRRKLAGYGLTGTLSWGVGQLTKLGKLSVCGRALREPESHHTLCRDLGGNNIQGTIPSQIGNLELYFL